METFNKNVKLSPEGQKDYEAFLSRVPGYFQNADFMNAVHSKITNDGISQINHEKLKERGDALVRVWSEETTIEDWATAE